MIISRTPFRISFFGGGTPFTLSFSPETEAGEPIVAATHVEKVFGVDGIFPMGVLKIKRMPE